MKAIELFFEEHVGIEVEVHEKFIENLPLAYKDNFTFYMLSLFEHEFILVKYRGAVPNVEKMSKQLISLEKITGENIIFTFSTLSKFKRVSLIKEMIPFIDLNGSMSVPKIGLILNKVAKSKAKKLSKFNNSMQMIFIQFMLKESRYTVKQLVKELGMSNTSVSRVLADFTREGILKCEDSKHFDRTKTYFIESKKELFNACRNKLVNPIQKVIYTNQFNEKWLLSGESLLAEQTSIADPEKGEYAVYKKRLHVDMIYHPNDDDRKEVATYKLEVWKYDPSLFSSNNRIDPISLFSIFSDHPDARVAIAINEFMEEYEWYEE